MSTYATTRLDSLLECDINLQLTRKQGQKTGEKNLLIASYDGAIESLGG